jgi:hypothetical protein
MASPRVAGPVSRPPNAPGDASGQGRVGSELARAVIEVIEQRSEGGELRPDRRRYVGRSRPVKEGDAL